MQMRIVAQSLLKKLKALEASVVAGGSPAERQKQAEDAQRLLRFTAHLLSARGGAPSSCSPIAAAAKVDVCPPEPAVMTASGSAVPPRGRASLGE